jgi:hypothetical protein
LLEVTALEAGSPELSRATPAQVMMSGNETVGVRSPAPLGKGMRKERRSVLLQNGRIDHVRVLL